MARTIRNVRVQTLIQFSGEVMSVLERRGISVLRISRPNKSFIIGSRPVVKLTSPGRTDLSDPRVEMWMPIASDIAVGVGRGDGGVSLHHAEDGATVRQLNLSIASRAGRSQPGRRPWSVRSPTLDDPRYAVYDRSGPVGAQMAQRLNRQGRSA